MAHDCPALIVGDLNCNLQEMAVWQDMMDSGWNDAALVQQSRDGHAPQKTYKEVSRIDYVLFNKKALPAFQWLTVSAQPETDHKTLVAQFDWSVLPAMRNVFKSPVNVDHIPMDKQRCFNKIGDKEQLSTSRSRKKGLQRCQLRDEDMHCIKIGATWKQAKAEAKVVDVSKGAIKLRKVKGQIDNGEICQYTPTAVPKAILHEAKTYWNQFWNTKRDEQPGDAMIQDAISALPQLSEMNPDFDMNDLEWALRKLQTGKAKGMDGFSNFELKYMPNNLKPSLLQLLNLFTKTGRWPDSLTHARMALLNKTDQIGDISTTRPITILATVYRSSTDMTAAIQLQMEEALLLKTELAGVSLDFSKAYNTLSRPVLECINKRLGMQLAWQPYQKFLNSLQRHFTCGGSWGPAITAEIGVPEGCPVAVVQMMVMTWMFTAAMKQKTDVDLFSYVDDWMMMTKHPEQLVCAIQQLDKLARKVGLILSLPKSHVFALQTKTARAIRGNLIHKGIKIGLAKNFQSLGVNLQTTHKLSVTLRNQRWNKAKVLLNRLQYMPWDRRRKVAILTRGIYPLIFFGVQCWPTGKDFLREVRAKSNHTIWGKQQYHLHFLAPLFSGGNYEPMLVVVMSRFRAFMRMFTQHMEQTKRVWKTSVEKKTFFKNQTKGIVGLFQNQLLELDWALQADGRCTTPDGWTFVVWEITVAQFEKRVMSSWEDKLLLQLQPKQYLTDLYSFSVTRSQYPRHKDAMLDGFMNKMSGDIWEAVRNMPTSQLFGALYPKLPLVEEYKQRWIRDPPMSQKLQACSQEINNQFFEQNCMHDYKGA
ncbi:putative 149 kDa protein [Symbiodinium microadriaticum]|uniref:Putative 149 kDa protein n=1 Tax=Symbiodinium microadriaticum TaxID=2951 RepID=A0A1Q9CMB9_SYMMI|nr:putative 149 kDa protein [Symbiodinium microadriaticum]